MDVFQETREVPKRKPQKPIERELQEVPDEMLKLPERLQKAMGEEGLNATQLGELAGVSTQVITRILRAERLKGMRGSSVVLLARALGWNLDYLLAGVGPERRVAVTDSAGAEAIVRATLRSLGYEASGSKRTDDERRVPTEDAKQIPR